MKSGDLMPLADVAAAMDDAAQQRLAVQVARLRAVEAELGALSLAAADQGATDQPGGLAALDRHRRWVSARRQALLVRQAEARGAVEAARLAAQQAYGRRIAIDELLAAARQEERTARDRRRAEQGSA
jgi:hypothetical protein